MKTDRYPGWNFQKDAKGNYFGTKKGYLYAIEVCLYKGVWYGEILTRQKTADGRYSWYPAHRNPYQDVAAKVIEEIEKRHAFHNQAA